MAGMVTWLFALLCMARQCIMCPRSVPKRVQLLHIAGSRCLASYQLQKAAGALGEPGVHHGYLGYHANIIVMKADGLAL